MTNDEKVEVYENFFHRINMYYEIVNVEKITEAISLINSWSYSHRMGNGAISEKEKQPIVNNYINKMKEY